MGAQRFCNAVRSVRPSPSPPAPAQGDRALHPGMRANGRLNSRQCGSTARSISSAPAFFAGNAKSGGSDTIGISLGPLSPVREKMPHGRDGWRERLGPLYSPSLSIARAGGQSSRSGSILSPAEKTYIAAEFTLPDRPFHVVERRIRHANPPHTAQLPCSAPRTLRGASWQTTGEWRRDPSSERPIPGRAVSSGLLASFGHR